jgi:hypothetical protein
MIKILSCLLVVFFVSTFKAEESCGYISYSTINIGDDIQAIAAKRFLPDNAIPIDREYINTINSPFKIKTIVNGWFMHEKSSSGEYFLSPLPEKSWPPAPSIEPFFISIHLTGSFQPTVFSEENIEYLKAHAPIGARDFYTLEALQQKGIPSYFSGCLTLTLENMHTERNDIIYLVDLDDASVGYIKSKVSSPVVVITHGKPLLMSLSAYHRLQYANYILDLYRKAKCVVTTRLHTALPCLAFKTPVLMVDKHDLGNKDSRFWGLTDHTRSCSARELCEGLVDYDFDHPPENPTTYLPIRENLIKIMTEWAQKNGINKGVTN